MSNNNYSQLCPVSFTGAKEIQVSKIDFETCCPCQITACDGGTINVCAKVKFKEGFDFDGDICDIDGSATFNSFTAADGFYVENEFFSTCENPVGRTRAISYRSDTSGGTPILSTRFENQESSPSDAAFVQINSVQAQGTLNPVGDDQCGIQIKGGTSDITKNVRINTDSSQTDAKVLIQSPATDGEVNIEANKKILIATDPNVNAATLTLEARGTQSEILMEARKTIQLKSMIDGAITFQTFGTLGSMTSISSGYYAVTAQTDLNLVSNDGDINIENNKTGGKIDITADEINFDGQINLGPEIDKSVTPPITKTGAPGDKKGDLRYLQDLVISPPLATRVGYLFLCCEDYATAGGQQIWVRFANDTTW